MFTFRTTSYNLLGNYILTLPVPKTTSYGLRSFSNHTVKLSRTIGVLTPCCVDDDDDDAVKLWNSLPDNVRTLNLTDFKKH